MAIIEIVKPDKAKELRIIGAVFLLVLLEAIREKIIGIINQLFNIPRLVIKLLEKKVETMSPRNKKKTPEKSNLL